MLSRLLLASLAVCFSCPLADAGEQRARAPRTQVVVYPLADLIVPIPNQEQDSGPANSVKTTETQLRKLLLTTLAPSSWAEAGGQGIIDYYPLTMSFVIRQTPEVHEQIAELLARLRKLQDIQVALEIRIISVREDLFERVGIDFEQPARLADLPRPEQFIGGFLGEDQFRRFMDAVQGDARSNVMQAPKLMLFNGQRSTLRVGEEQFFLTGYEQGRPINTGHKTGLNLSVQPVVSADGSSVQVHFKMEQTELASSAIPLVPVNDQAQFVQQPKFHTLSLEKTMVIPQGRTLVLAGPKKLVETRLDYGPPVLSKVPYVNRLFKNVGCGQEAQSVLVAITPRIVAVSEEQQEAPSGKKEALGELLRAYEQACAEGRTEEAAALARAALILDPRCFSKSKR